MKEQETRLNLHEHHDDDDDDDDDDDFPLKWSKVKKDIYQNLTRSYGTYK